MNILSFESEAGKEFRSIVKGNNFMTPKIEDYEEFLN